MTINIKKQADGDTQVVIEDEMTIYTVLEQKNQLIPEITPDQSLHIDLAGVSEIDSAGMQLLIHIKQKSVKLNNRLIITHHSQAVVEVIELFDLTSFFGDPIIIPVDWSES